MEETEELKDDLQSKELFKRDVKNILSYVTPYVPLIGLACGAICLGKDMLKKRSENRATRGNQEE